MYNPNPEHNNQPLRPFVPPHLYGVPEVNIMRPGTEVPGKQIDNGVVVPEITAPRTPTNRTVIGKTAAQAAGINPDQPPGEAREPQTPAKTPQEPPTEVPAAAERPEPEEPLPPPAPPTAEVTSPDEPGEPFGVGHFNEEPLDPASNNYLNDVFNAHVDTIRERLAPYADVVYDEDASEVVSLVHDSPEGAVALTLQPGLISVSFTPVNGTAQAYCYYSENGTVRREDEDIAAIKERTPEPGTVPEAEAAAAYREYVEKVKPYRVEEADLGLNRQPVGPRQLAYILDIAERALPPKLAFSDLQQTVINRFDSKSVSESDSELGAYQLGRHVATYLSERGLYPIVSPNSIDRGTILNDDQSFDFWEAGYRRASDQTLQPYIEITNYSPATPKDLVNFGPELSPEVLERAMFGEEELLVATRLTYGITAGQFEVERGKGITDSECRRITPEETNYAWGDQIEASQARTYLFNTLERYRTPSDLPKPRFFE